MKLVSVTCVAVTCVSGTRVSLPLRFAAPPTHFRAQSNALRLSVFALRMQILFAGLDNGTTTTRRVAKNRCGIADGNVLEPPGGNRHGRRERQVVFASHEPSALAAGNIRARPPSQNPRLAPTAEVGLSITTDSGGKPKTAKVAEFCGVANLQVAVRQALAIWTPTQKRRLLRPKMRFQKKCKKEMGYVL